MITLTAFIGGVVGGLVCFAIDYILDERKRRY